MMTARVVICLVACSKRCPTEMKLRRVLRTRETLRRNQPSPRKMIAMIDGMQRSMGAPTKEECIAGPVVMRPQANKSDKVHPLKVKEAMSSVDESTEVGFDFEVVL